MCSRNLLITRCACSSLSCPTGGLPPTTRPPPLGFVLAEPVYEFLVVVLYGFVLALYLYLVSFLVQNFCICILLLMVTMCLLLLTGIRIKGHTR